MRPASRASTRSNGRDEEPREHEEDVDADRAPVPEQRLVRQDDEDDGDSTQSIEPGPVAEPPCGGLTGSHRAILAAPCGRTFRRVAPGI